ncbi:SAG family member [Eimeria praecox]|uniref:SAG family member n=1 Tax=Eimeria praecox TaxID=51316 RepID=U6G5Q7_9EIME|nr:SAG family member [Eimeria praecox]
MAGLKLLSLATAAVFFVAKEASAAESQNTATRVDCTTDMNAARSRGEFANLVVDLDTLKLPITKAQVPSVGDSNTETPNTDYLKQVCDAMKANQTIQTTINPAGTYAYAAQDGEKADCKAAVDYWKKAFKNFEGVPPVYKKDEAPYTDAQNVSLISLFNPKSDPKVDCAYFICPAATTTGTGAGAQASAAGETTTDKELRALLCVTSPPALTDQQAPFTETEWGKVTTAVNSSNAAVPTLLAVAGAAMAALFL